MQIEEGQSKERETWGNPVEFLMSCISMSVGLGNTLPAFHLSHALLIVISSHLR